MKIHLTQDDVTSVLVRYFHDKFFNDLKTNVDNPVVVQPKQLKGGATVTIELATEDV